MDKERKKKRALSDKILDIFVYTTLIIFSLMVIIPFMQVITISVSSSQDISRFGLHLFPKSITLEGYKRVFQYKLIYTSYWNTIMRTIIGTSLATTVTLLAAYPLSKKYLPHRNIYTACIIFTMYFSGGLIPTYLLVRNLGMINHLSALIFPGLVSAYTLIITRNFIMMLPDSIEEAAKIDGAGDLRIFLTIIVPLSKPIIATISLWYGVYHWNAWFDSMLYTQDEKKYVLQYVLRKILMEGQIEDITADLSMQMNYVNTDTMKMATLIVSIIPIICVYPFLQKYFVKGVMVGSLKG